jgi:hypothetical protein
MDAGARLDHGRRILRLWKGARRWPARRVGVQWEEGNAGMQRWLRDPEPFERRGEYDPFPAATVLDDLVPETSEQETLRVLARYTATRVLILWGAGVLHGSKLLTERRVASGHLGLLPVHDWERRTLMRLVASCRDQPAPAALLNALAPAESAARRGHFLGAFALYRGIWDIALRHGWLEQATSAAAGIARLAAMSQAPRSVRLWSWRVRVLMARQRVLLQEGEVVPE